MPLSPEELKQITRSLQRQIALGAEAADGQRSIRDVLIDQTKQLTFQQTLKKDILGATNQIYNLEYDLRTTYNKQLGTKEAQLDIEKNIGKTLKSKASLEQDIINLEKEGSELSRNIAESIKEQVKEADKVLDTLKQQASTSKEIRNNFGVRGFQGLSELMSKMGGKASQLASPFEKAAEASRAAVQDGVEANDKIKERGVILEKIKNGELKATKKNLEGIDILGKKGKKIYGNAAKEALKSGTATTANIGKTLSKGKLATKGLMAGLKVIGPVLMKMLGPVTLIIEGIKAVKFFFDSMVAASKATAEMSRNMLISRDAARDLYSKVIPGIVGQFNELAKEQGNVTITAASYSKALSSINGELGMQLNLSQDFGKSTVMNVAEVAKMQENFGLSAKASTQLFLEATKTGVPLEEMNKSIFGTLGLMSAQSGLQLDFNKVIEEAASVSGVLRANFGGSTEAIAKAVYQAKLLGMTLDQTQSISSGLLDFESSIASELEAELLIGRDLNLEKAREYALAGDTVGLMQEISKEAGTQEDFNNMNFKAREAIAGALKMEVNALSDMYEKKSKNDALIKKNLEVQNKLKEAGIQLQYDADGNILNSMAEIRIASQAAGKSEAELRKILEDQVYLRKSEEDATQKFKKAIEQAKEAFSRLVDGGALDKLADILTGLTESALFSGFAEEGRAKNILAKAEKEKNTKNQSIAAEALEAQSQATGTDDTVDVMGAFAAGATGGALLGLAGGPFAPLTSSVGALAGGLIGITAAITKNNFDQKKADKTLLEAESLYPSDNVEDFILRPGQRPIKFNKDDLLIGGTSLGGGGNDEVAMLLKELISEIRSGGDVYLDSTKVGTALTVGSYKMQ